MKEERKNLANCTPLEFMQQAYRIKHAAEKWIKSTNILDIRKRKIDGFETIPPDASDDLAQQIRDRNKKRVSEQLMKNASEVFESIFKDHQAETLELLALVCFVEPEHVNDHKFSWYAANIGDILSDSDTLDFFTSLVQLDQIGFLKL